MQEVITEESLDRLDKLYTYFDHFEVETRYELSFKEFVRKVDAGSWDAYLA
jgi:hypothetical protein